MKHLFMHAAAALALAAAAGQGIAAPPEPVGGLVRRADWGIAVAPPERPGAGARIARVRPQGAAAGTALAVGDLVVAIDGEPPGDAEAFSRRWRRYRAGDAATLTLERDGRRFTQHLVAGAIPLERIDGVEVRYDSVVSALGDRTRLLWTLPSGAVGRLPLVAFVPWLSCSAVETGVADGDGWKQMLRDVARESGWATLRIEKPGTGDSLGPDCADNDLERDLAAFRAALHAARAAPFVDPGRIVLFGGSFGASFVPLLAAEFGPAGIVASGGFNRTLFEHLLGFDRRRLALEGSEPAALAAAMRALATVYARVLFDGRTPGEVLAAQPALRPHWREGERHVFGRPLAYYRQIQALDVEADWARVTVPTLVVHGEHDWFMALEDQQRIVELVNRRRPGTARLVVVPGMNHHFERFANAKAAFDEEGGTYAPEAAQHIVAWLRALAPRR
ncbi:MAG: alpha/beta fold hydrolase [Piscinibacter sp.]|uniref:PDZ domain-containing protein n=1 Tax=Piscinibacter TaxID=1114981 RepID=UPI000FDD8CAB|nr:MULTISPECIES: PDZ domain-containing protein [Piscinibacter]MCW5666422.1 alpha/beta fold hydrolase [Piscinibacter sp.]